MEKTKSLGTRFKTLRTPYETFSRSLDQENPKNPQNHTSQSQPSSGHAWPAWLLLVEAWKADCAHILGTPLHSEDLGWPLLKSVLHISVILSLAWLARG